MKNTTNIKIPKQYHAMLENLYKEDNLYKVVAKEGYYFPTVNNNYAESTNQTKLWNVLRYVAVIGTDVPVITPKVKGEVKAVKPTQKEELKKALEELEEAKKEIEALKQAMVGAVNLVTIIQPVVVEEVVEEVIELLPELEYNQVNSLEEMSVKELWALGKSYGFKGCTRWAKKKLIEEISKKEA